MTAPRSALVIAVVLVTTTVLGAQTPTGRLTVVLAGELGKSEAQVQVVLSHDDATGRVVRSDSGSQKLTLESLPSGRFRLETRAIGFVPETTFVEIHSGQHSETTVTLDRVTALDPVTVSGTGKGHLTPFERRRASGKGTFLTAADVEKNRRMTDALRSVRGLRVDCNTGSCRVLMVRSTTCEPRYFINGFPSTAEVLLTPVLDVAGIEIYRGPSETPAEFMGDRSMCGALAVWTK